MKRRAHWSFVKVDHANKIVWIRDDDGPLSVTNAAEQVVSEAIGESEDGKDTTTYRLFYKDSDDRWDELLHAQGERFLGFAPGTSGFMPPER
jgi:hypothetical protein